MEQKQECVNVSLRIKPSFDDKSGGSSLQIISKVPPVLVVSERSQVYNFDNIFSEDEDQETVYSEAVKPLVNYVKKGYSCTVFAYGQTGTGKSYTMGTGLQNPVDSFDSGIIPRALKEVFDHQNINADQDVDVSVSFSEIYNEKVFDLLQPKRKTPLPVSGFVVQELSIKNVKNITEAIELLELGNKSRHVGETKQNLSSSRSHAIFTVYFTLKNSDQNINGKLNLVDLAGSESVRKTESQGSTFREGININKGLLSIGQVISALSTKCNYIPYRQSMITTILQGSLNIENYISLIACVSSRTDDITETLQTLDFAQRAKKIRNNPEINQIISKYKRENPTFGSSRTPMKRPLSTPLKASAVKKMALAPLPFINETTHSQISDNSKSHCSIDISSVSTRISSSTDITQQALSPVIRKYVTKMEVSIMDRLESVIKSTLRRPTRTSLQNAKSLQENEKENTPGISWNKIQNEVAKMVKNEIAQMTVNTVRATSSPIEESDKDKVRRILNYTTPDNLKDLGIVPLKATPEEQSKDSFSFKVPKLPDHKKKTTRRTSKLSISPIENDLPKITPRRSIRLSLKKQNNNLNIKDLSDVSFDCNYEHTEHESKMPQVNDDTMCENDSTFRKINCQSPDEAHTFSTTALCSPRDSSDFQPSNINTVKRKNHSVSVYGLSAKRRSIRIAKKKEYCQSPVFSGKKRKSVVYTVTKTPSKSLVSTNKREGKDSPFTAHSKKVLYILNKGSLKELEKLHSVGVKTAEQIILYRKLKGNFEGIADLAMVPGWGTKRFEKFMACNLLKKD